MSFGLSALNKNFDNGNSSDDSQRNEFDSFLDYNDESQMSLGLGLSSGNNDSFFDSLWYGKSEWWNDELWFLDGVLRGSDCQWMTAPERAAKMDWWALYQHGHKWLLMTTIDVLHVGRIWRLLGARLTLEAQKLVGGTHCWCDWRIDEIDHVRVLPGILL